MKPQYLIAAAVLLALYIASRSARVAGGLAVGADLPRGVRNNNPGNIRVSSNQWQGKKPLSENTDAGHTYEQFYIDRQGIRAIVRLLITYTERYQIASCRAIADRWAPAHENDSVSYAAGLAKSAGVSVDERIEVMNPAIMLGLVRGIIKNENGTNVGIGWYADSKIMEVVKQTLAGG